MKTTPRVMGDILSALAGLTMIGMSFWLSWR
jgi:hypothetical protein